MIIETLNRVQQELKAPKSQRNTFGGYNYRSCEDILESVKPILAKYGAVLTISDELVAVGDRYYVKATATLTDANGEHFTTTAYAREEETKKGMDASQITGASSSYARKYALNGLFAIDDTKDSDATNTGTDEPRKSAPVQAQQPKEPKLSADVLKQATELGINLKSYAVYKKVAYEQLTDELVKEGIEIKKQRMKGKAQ